MQSRKRNRLNFYDYNTNGLYFITICTKDKVCNLSQIVGDGSPIPKIKLSKNGKIIAFYIDEIRNKFSNTKIEYFVIMPNHIHLIINLDDGTGNPSPTIGSIIGWFKYQITKDINLLNSTQGAKFWQRSYYDHVIRNEQEYLEIIKYIQENPIKWELDSYYRKL